MIIVEPSVEILDEPNIYKRIELAGRICYKTENLITDTSHEKFIKMIIRRGHYSVLEHSSITVNIKSWDIIKNFIPQHLKDQFIEYGSFDYRTVVANARAWRELLEVYPIKGMITAFPVLFGDIDLDNRYVIDNSKHDVSLAVPSEKTNPYTILETFIVNTSRDISHQLVRHRINSVSQESQRYCNYTLGKFSDVKFIMPDFIKESEDEKLKEYWLSQRRKDEEEYAGYISKGIAPESARNCLPNATATSIVLTSSIWGWKHFLGLRLAPDAQKEIRVIASDIQKILLEKYVGTDFYSLLT